VEPRQAAGDEAQLYLVEVGEQLPDADGENR
jgi:hypothetical protein